MALRSTPFSPWMPRPSSISLSASVKPDFSAPGSVAAQGHAHRAELRGRLARGGGDLRQRQPQAAPRRDLVHQHGAGDAPPTFARRVPAQRHVVGDDGDLHRDALGAGQLGGQAEVQPVAGVVLDDQQGPVGPGRGADGRQHRIGGRRGEYLAADRRAQHAGADIAGVRRLDRSHRRKSRPRPPLRRRQIAAHQHMLIAQEGRPRRLPRRASSISRTSPDGSLMSFFIVGPPQNEKALAKEP